MENFVIISQYYNIISEEVSSLLIDSAEITYFDAETDDLTNLIDNINSISLFNEKKTIIIKNIDGSLIEANKELIENLLTSYIESPNPNVQIILTLTKKIGDNRKIGKLINNNLKVKDFSKYTSKDYLERINKYINKSKYKITSNNTYLLYEKCLKNYDIVINELNKLFVAAFSTKEISQEMINKYVADYMSDEIFKLKDLIIKRDIEGYNLSLKRYESEKKSVILLISILAKEYRLMYLIKNTKYNDQELARELDYSSSYSVTIARKNAYEYHNKELLSNLVKLADLDYNIKSGEIDEYLGINLFLLEI